MHKVYTLVLVLACGCPAAVAQTHTTNTGKEKPEAKNSSTVIPADAPVVHSLEITNTILTRTDDQLMTLPFGCDEKGNVYIQSYDISLQNRAGKIIKLNLQGDDVANFTNPDPGVSPVTFFVAKDGTVYQLARQVPSTDEKKPLAPETYLLRYNRDGTFEKKVKFDTNFHPTGSFVVFPSGEVLVSALELQKPDERTLSAVPFTAIFDESGRLVKRVTVKQDAEIMGALETGNESLVGKTKNGGNQTVSYGRSLIGSDGNAYVLRRTSPAMVFVISSSGEVLRTLNLDSGTPPLMPLLMLENNRQIAILFRNWGPGETRIRTFDENSGAVLDTLAVDPQIGTGVACYSPPQFTFVRVKEKKFSLELAQAK